MTNLHEIPSITKTEENVELRSSCAICDSGNLFKFLDLGSTPLADRFVYPAKINDPEPLFPLEVAVCPHCRLVQLLHLVDDRLLFGDDYAFFTSASPQAVIHFRNYADELTKSFPELVKGLVVEIASNDGVLLMALKERGVRVLGIEPSHNVASVCDIKGVETIQEFFNSKTAEEIANEYGRADLILANNVVAHVKDVRDLMQGVKKLLAPKGVFIFEVQYFQNLMFKNQFDHIYHEHRFYFSLFPLDFLLRQSGLAIFDVQEVDTQGGSIRVFAAHREADRVQCPSSSVSRLLHNEEAYKLGDISVYGSLQLRAVFIKIKLQQILESLRSQGKRVVGYGAPAKGNTLLNYCQIGTQHIAYLIDKTAYKHGKLTPGMHIPVHPAEKILEDGLPDYYFLLVWNYATAMLMQEEAFRKSGGKFIIPIPAPEVV